MATSGTVFVVTRLSGCFLCIAALSQLWQSPAAAALPHFSSVLCNFSVCVWLALFPSSSPPLVLLLVPIVSHYHSLHIGWGLWGVLILLSAAFQRLPKFTHGSSPLISFLVSVKYLLLLFCVCLHPPFFAPGGFFPQLYLFASFNFRFINPASLVNCARRWDNPSPQKVKEGTRGRATNETTFCC